MSSARILYENHRKEVAIRHIIPEVIRHGTSEWHKTPQWLLRAIVGVCNAEKNIAPGLKQLLLAAETLLMNGEKELPKVET